MSRSGIPTGAMILSPSADHHGQSWSAAPSVTGFTLHSVMSLADDVWAVGQTNEESMAIHYTDPCSRSRTGSATGR